MEQLQFLLISLLLLSFLYLLPKIIKYRSSFSPPGPVGLPFIGNLHQINPSSLHTSLWPSFLAQRKLSYNGLDVAFAPHNEYWREIRKIITIHLLSPKRIQSSRNIRGDEVSRTMKKIHGIALSSKHVNLSEITMSAMNTILMRVGFGKRYEDGQERDRILRLLSELQAMVTTFFVSDYWPDLPFVGLIDKLMGKMYRLEKCFQDLDLFYQEQIDEHLDDPQNSKIREEEQDIIDILIQLKKDQVLIPFELTTNHIKAMLADVLVGGTDASAATVVWAMTALVKNPKVMKKAQEEVRKMVGKKDQIDEDDLPKLTYLKAVVKEIMRLYPPAPLLVPRETKTDVILHGYQIKQKTLVYVNAFAIGRDPKSWENPEEFSPERFLDSDVDFRGNDFKLISFGAGRRICPRISMGVITYHGGAFAC